MLENHKVCILLLIPLCTFSFLLGLLVAALLTHQGLPIDPGRPSSFIDLSEDIVMQQYLRLPQYPPAPPIQTRTLSTPAPFLSSLTSPIPADSPAFGLIILALVPISYVATRYIPRRRSGLSGFP